MSTPTEISALSTPRKLLLASGGLLFINSFLPWYDFPFIGGQSGWHQLGTLVWVVLAITLIWEGARLAGVAPIRGKQADLATAAGAGLVLLLGVIYVIVRLADGWLGIGVWLGIVLLAVFGYAAFQLFQASGGQAAVREVQAEAAQRRAQNPGADRTPPVTPPHTSDQSPVAPPASDDPPTRP